MKSIRRWFLGWLIFGFVAASGIAAFGIFHTAREEASELFDYELRAVALSLPRSVAPGNDALASEDRIVIDIWDDSNRLVYSSQHALPGERMQEGFRTIERDEKHWRVFGSRQPDRFVQVAQPVSVRDALALRLALRTLWPFGLLLPATIALVLVVIARGLEPIGSLSRALSTRSFDALEPLRPNVPVEIEPLVQALNDLLARLNAASHAQRTFVADAAHELRSPLTALKLQLQAAERDGSLKGEGLTLDGIQTRLNRIIHLVQQLLALAREDAQAASAMSPISLRRLAEQAVSDFWLLAEAKAIDLGLEFVPPSLSASDRFEVMGEPHALTVLLNNLLDNAIRHTPTGGRVDLVLRRDAHGIGVEVRDTGPGIPEAELTRVFDRFYRGEQAQGQGSGLGLAIVSRIAQRHRVTLQLRNNGEATGLIVSVSGFGAPQVTVRPSVA
ncbi:MAG TPA: ATP-binding protein [Trinickia sp.]|jgi:two-component system OmpR family sensor kinase|nr:ATP-binding protein [Trinickia sp.]